MEATKWNVKLIYSIGLSLEKNPHSHIADMWLWVVLIPFSFGHVVAELVVNRIQDLQVWIQGPGSP